MSECQIVQFRAIDRPLSEEQLKFADKQSSRATYTRWDFQVEYQYGSFRGDINGLLRNGYDVCLNYSNYGDCEIRLRLPNGLPFPKSVWSTYLEEDGLRWTPDAQGPAGILTIRPYLEERDALDEIDDGYLDAAAKAREMLISADPRVLYVLWLCAVSGDNYSPEEVMEPPVPHGLESVPAELLNLLDFFGYDIVLVQAAAEGTARFDVEACRATRIRQWLASLSSSRTARIVEELLLGDAATLKQVVLAEFQADQAGDTWPFSAPRRMLAELIQQAGKLREQEVAEEKRRREKRAIEEAREAERLRQIRLGEMRESPNDWIKRAKELVKVRGSSSYKEAASILADLREALGEKKGEQLVRRHAAEIIQRNPTLSILKSAFRQRGLLS